jgi:enamine deaminase RidA (YjgF/YER057c/UK114 family)
MTQVIRRRVNSTRFADLVVHAHVARWVEVANDASQDTVGQIEQILSQIDQMLTDLGCERSHLLEVQIFLADLQDVPSLNAAWDAWVDSKNPPSRICVGVQLQGSLKAEFIVRAAVGS